MANVSEPYPPKATLYLPVAPKPIGRREFVRVGGGIALTVAAGSACGDSNATAVSLGIVRVTILGLPPGVTDAGSALITTGPLGGTFPPQTITLVAATGEMPVPAGNYHVVYTPPPGYSIAPGSSNEVDVTIDPRLPTDVSFSVVPAAATLDITVTGLAAGASLGGSASVLRTDLPAQTPMVVPVPGTGTASASVNVGTYSVTYTPPSGYGIASGTSSVVSNIVITPGSTGSAGFTVTETATGTLRITVAGLAGASSGGSASVLRSAPGQTPTVVTIPASGTRDTLLPVGTYEVTYTAPSGRQVAAGQTNPQTLNITASTVSDFQITVETVVVPADIVFHADWSTGVGTSLAALLDSSKVPPWAVFVTVHTSDIVVATGLDFPTTNVFRVRSQGDAEILRVSTLPVPAVGQSLFYRWYVRVAARLGLQNGTHPIQDGTNIGSCNWAWRVENSGASTYGATFEVDSVPQSNNNGNFGNNLTFDKNVTYRWELQLFRNAASTFQLHARVYNSSNVLLLDDADFGNFNNSQTLASNPSLNFNNVNSLSGLNCGVNGLSGASGVELYSYQGGFCVRTDDWCGPYLGGI